MKVKSLFVFLLLITISITATGKKYEEGKLYKHTLPNGLMVLTMERHIAPLIYSQLTYKVGSRNERLGITGISHICEHLMFKGTPTYGKGVASKTITDNAGIFNAFTMQDMTSYYEYLPKDKIEIAFKIESDRMQNCQFDPKEFKSEIEVIKQERRMRTESQVQGVFGENLNSVAYTSQPERDPVIGWPGDLDHVTRDQAYNYYKTYYTPNNSALVLVGDFDTDKILKLVEKYYGNIPKGPDVPEIYVYEQPQSVRKTFTLIHDDVTDPSFRMVFHAPLYTDSDAAALRVAGMILCEKSRDARLYKRLVEKEQNSTMCAGGFGMTKDPGLFSISVSMMPDSSVDRAEKMVWEEIQKMKDQPVLDNELQKVKNRYKFGVVTDYVKNADIGTRLSRYQAYFTTDLIQDFDNKVMNVTKDDIMKVMKKYFNPNQVTVGYMYPKDKNKVKSKGNDEEKNQDESQSLYEQDKFYYQIPEEAINVINRIAKGDLDNYVKPAPIEPMVKIMKLDNGVTIYAMENHLVPEISVIGMFDTGLMPEGLDGQKPGLPDLLADMMNRGTETKSYAELSERMAFVPYSFVISGSYKGFYFQGASLVEDANEMMKTGYEIVTKPALATSELEKLKPRAILNANNRLKKVAMQAFYWMFNQIFEDHTLTKFNPTEESVKSISREDLVALHNKYFNPKHLCILIEGDMTAQQMKDLTNKYFGQWVSNEKDYQPMVTPPVKDFNKKEIKVFPEKSSTQCTINIGFKPFNNIPDDEEETVSILNHILASSALTSRMGVELRDKQGLFYGIRSELWKKSDKIGYWKFNTQTAPKNCEKLIKGIFAEIKKLLKDGITDDELLKAKQRQLGLLPFYVETPDDAASFACDMIQNKQPLNFFDKKAERILKVTKDDVLRVAKKYFTMDKFAIVVDGPIEEHSLDQVINEL